MAEQSANWDYRKDAVKWGSRRSMWQLITATIVLPVVEGILVNLWTDAAPSEAYLPGLLLVVIVILHSCHAFLILLGDQTYPVGRIVDAVETENRLCRLETEFNRRVEAYRMVRGLIHAINKQTCFLVWEPWCRGGYQREFLPVVRNFTQNVRSTLGVTSDEYTIEIHLKPEGLYSCEDEFSSHNSLIMPFFFSPQ